MIIKNVLIEIIVFLLHLHSNKSIEFSTHVKILHFPNIELLIKKESLMFKIDKVDFKKLPFIESYLIYYYKKKCVDIKEGLSFILSFN